MGLYRGAGWTAARNAPGSFAVRSRRALEGRWELTRLSLGRSSLVVRRSRRSTCSDWRTTDRLPGRRTLSPVSLDPSVLARFDYAGKELTLSCPQVSSIAISQPLDVIKTRIQNQAFESKNGGMWVIRDLMKNEGFGGFFKGFTPKVLCVPFISELVDGVRELTDLGDAASSDPSSSSRSRLHNPLSPSSASSCERYRGYVHGNQV